MDYKKECDKEYLKKYLESIKSKNGKYKRVVMSPLRYAGGKSNAIGLILEYLPELKEKKIISPFFGGGSLELVLTKELGFEVIGFDIFELLTNFWTQLIDNKIELSEQLKKLIPDKKNFTHNRHILLNYWDKIKPEYLIYKTRRIEKITDKEKKMLDEDKILQATYYYYNMQLSYGPMFLGWQSSVYLDEIKYKKIINKIETFDCGNLKVSCNDFENVIKNYPNDFLFLDPPYYLDDDSKMFKGMYPNCNFPIHHKNFNHELLRDLLKNHKGGFLMTYNNCSTIKNWYKNYKQIFPEWKYTYGQGEKRIGKNRKNGTNDNIKESHEMFIIDSPH
jgi:DNA adenine methylase